VCKDVHEMLGHLGWKTIQRGLAQVQGCEGLVKLLEGVGDNRHCTACELTKSKLWHAVLITSLVLLEAVEEGSAKATGKDERTTVWEAHFGVKPRLDQYLLGPFGCLAFLLLSEEQRRQRGLCGHFGDRSLQGIYLGCTCDSTCYLRIYRRHQ
jgi:hypothetical protein